MRRREFITLVGGAAAWSFVANAQQPARPVVGFLSSQSPDTYSPFPAAFRDGLKEQGFSDGENVTIEYRGRTANSIVFRRWQRNWSI